MKIIYITHFFPKYRFEIFNRIANYYNNKLDVFASLEEKIGFDLKTHEKLNFSISNSKVCKILIFNKKIYFQKDSILQIFKNRNSIIFLSALKSDISIWIALILGCVFRKKIILWGHCKYKKSFIDRMTSIVFFSLAKAVLFYSEVDKEMWKSHKSIYNKGFVANNTIAVNSKISMDTIELNRMQGLIELRKIIYSGRIESRKKVHLLLYALKVLLDEHFFLNIVVVGDGSDKRAIENIANDLNISSNVVFTGSIFDDNQLSEIYKTCDIAVIPSCAGLSINQSFAFGCPVITDNDFSKHGPEISAVIADETGFFYEANNYYDLANKIKFVLSNAQLLDHMKTASLKKYNDELSPEKMVDGFINVIDYVKR